VRISTSTSIARRSVRALDCHGMVELEAEGPLAVCIQHEMTI
jgi:peptide deformylase